MSAVRFDSTPWISGAVVFGDGGFGVVGALIPSTGLNGPGYAYNDLSLPADAAKEIAGRITTPPTLGTLIANEDTSFTYVGLSDTAYYQLYVDGTAVGSPTQIVFSMGISVVPNAGSLTISGYAPTIAQTANRTILPAQGVLAFTGYAPTVIQGGDRLVTSGAGSIAFTGYAPAISQSANIAIAPVMGSITFAGFAPIIAQSANVTITPAIGSIAFTGYTPIIAQSANIAIAPVMGSIAFAGFAPTVAQSGAQGISPAPGALTITGFAPTLVQTANKIIVPGVGSMVFAGFAPTISQTTGTPTFINPGVGTISLIGYAPIIDQTNNQFIFPGAGHITLVRFSPSVLNTSPIAATPASAPGRGRTLFRPNLDCTIVHSNGHDRYGQVVPGTRLAERCAIIKLEEIEQKTTVRADSSASRGAALEIVVKAKILLTNTTTAVIDDVIEIQGMKLRIFSRFPRHDLQGNLDHFEITAHEWSTA